MLVNLFALAAAICLVLAILGFAGVLATEAGLLLVVAIICAVVAWFLAHRNRTLL